MNKFFILHIIFLAYFLNTAIYRKNQEELLLKSDNLSVKKVLPYS